MEGGLVHYRGCWEEAEQTAVTAAILQVEGALQLPVVRAFEPWIVVRTETGRDFVYYMANRIGISETIVAQTATDLSHLILALL